MSKGKLAGIIIACTIAIIAAIVITNLREPTPSAETYTLITNISPSGAGSVSPSGGEYESGVQVTLTASPVGGYTFDHWSGSASGTTSTITITMDSDKSLTANFETAPSDVISWDEAQDHIGERLTVCGPVKSTYYSSGSKGKPTFLNIGEPYPDPDRFTVIIWGENRGNFPEPPESYYEDKDICVTGLIVSYEGIPEIEVTSPEQIEIQ